MRWTYSDSDGHDVVSCCPASAARRRPRAERAPAPAAAAAYRRTLLVAVVVMTTLARVPAAAQVQQGVERTLPVSTPLPSLRGLPPITAPATLPVTPAAAELFAPVPFAIGERLEYQVKFGFVKVGSGAMEVTGMDTVRGRHAWHTVFEIHGGTFFYRVNDRLESWLDARRLVSLRHWQDLNEGRRERERRFEIIPERGIFHEEGKDEQPTVPEPLDDGAFLYFIRTIPLEVGRTYEFDRYFRPDRNPVKVVVLRRERVSVPAGDFDAIVVQPIIKTRGIFSEGGEAEIWLSDDDDRIMLQMRSKLSFGSLSLALTGHRRGDVPGLAAPTTAAPPPR